MAQWIKVLSTKTGKLSLIPKFHLVELKLTFAKYHLTECMYVHSYTYTKFKNRKTCTLIKTPFCRRRSDFIDVFT